MSAAAPPLSNGRLPAATHGYHLQQRRDVRGRMERWWAADEDGNPVVVFAEPLPGSLEWPGTGWEEQLRGRLAGQRLAVIRDRFSEGGRKLLVFDAAPGATLWDVWDDPAA